MSTSRTTRTSPGTSGDRPAGGPHANRSVTFAATLAVLLTSTAFTGVFDDTRWVPPAVLTTAVVAATGALCRRRRAWPPLVPLTQLAALVLVLTLQFSGSAVLGVLPGPAAVGELSGLLGSALDTVRTGVPPVPADRALQFLVALGLGLITLLIDAVAVTAGAPAVAGLVLLCVFAVPASLADELLPWWSFVAGAAGFVVLLLVGERTGSRRGGDRRDRARRAIADLRTGFGKQALAFAAAATVVALLVGSTFTGIGTQGRLPGSDQSTGQATSGIGLRPFTSLRGQLRRDSVVDLFRVQGLPEEAYLRAMTLREFTPNEGWKLSGLTQGVPANGKLPVPSHARGPNVRRARVEITPLGYRDAWLPVFGVPVGLSGMGPSWRYDPRSGIAFTQVQQRSVPYVELAAFPEPTPQQLRRADAPARVDPAYLDTGGVDRRIIELAERITANAPTNFDKAVALNRYFTDPANGFTYELQTAPASSNQALADFLFRGKRGYCEQFASSMAVLLRAVGIPSRVAVGFTSGHQEGDARVITTEDAHAWVEAYFPGHGWVTFDPTPLQDGRTSLPSHLEQALNPEQPLPPGATTPSAPPTSSTPGPRTGERELVVPPRPGRPAPSSSEGIWLGGAVVLLALALAAAPALLRELRRRRRLRTVGTGESGATDAAWQEVLDSFLDRGTKPSATDTARKAGIDLADEHELDEDGERALRGLVTLVERAWYGPPGSATDPELSDLLSRVVGSLERTAPLSWRDRLLPRSVIRPGR